MIYKESCAVTPRKGLKHPVNKLRRPINMFIANSQLTIMKKMFVESRTEREAA